jgi:hypothetical protein
MNFFYIDGDYGSLERNNVTGRQEWTGLIGRWTERFEPFEMLLSGCYALNLPSEMDRSHK